MFFFSYKTPLISIECLRSNASNQENKQLISTFFIMILKTRTFQFLWLDPEFGQLSTAFGGALASPAQAVTQFKEFPSQNIRYNPKMMTILFLLLLQSNYAASAGLTLNLTNPFALRFPPVNINTLDLDPQNSFLVGFADGEARRYSADFSSYSSLIVPEAVDKFRSFSLTLNISLSNGTIWSMQGQMTTTLSCNFKTLRSYSDPNFTLIDSFASSEAILSYHGVPIFSPNNFHPLHILIFSQTIKVVYRNVTYTAFDFAASLGSGKNCTAAIIQKSNVSAVGDFIYVNMTTMQAVLGSGLVSVCLTLTLRYNFSSFSYDLSFGYNIRTIKAFNDLVTTMMVANNLLLLQNQQGSFLLDDIAQNYNQSFINDSFISSNPILSFIYRGGSYYLLYSRGLILLKLTNSNTAYQRSTLVSSLPNSTYCYVTGSLLSVVYKPFTPHIHKGSCQGQYYEDRYGSCIRYNCTVANCLQCSLTATTCSLCAIGFIRNDHLKCESDGITTPSTSYNGTSPTNNTNSSTSSTSYNGTSPTNNTNSSTSSPSNNGTVPTNNTNSTSPSLSNNVTSLTNNTNNSTPSQSYNGTSPNGTDDGGGTSIDNGTSPNNTDDGNEAFQGFSNEHQWLQTLFWMMLNTTKATISIPSMRKLAPILYYFGNFDDLYLYIYHDRIYGPTMKELFETVKAIEVAKWNMFSDVLDLKHFDLGNQTLDSQTDFEGEYLTYDYSFPNRESEGSEGLLMNCGNFIIFGIPLTLTAFLLLRYAFKVLFQRPCSRLLRKFDFWGYFLVLIFEGNVQQFAFCLTAEWRHAAAFAPWQRGVKAAVFLFGFVVVTVAVGGAFVLLAAYDRLNRHLSENNRNSLRGNAFLLLQCGVRNLILGILHSALRPLPYATMLSLMLCTEAAFVTAFVTAVPLGAYRSLHCVWAFLWLSLVRMLLIATLFFDYADVGNTLIETVQCVLIIAMLFIYVIATTACVMTTFFQLGMTIKSVICSSYPNLSPQLQPSPILIQLTAQGQSAAFPLSLNLNSLVLPFKRQLYTKQRNSKAVFSRFKGRSNVVDIDC